MAFLKHKQAFHGILYHGNSVGTAAKETKTFILFKKHLPSPPTEPGQFWRDMKAPHVQHYLGIHLSLLPSEVILVRIIKVHSRAPLKKSVIVYSDFSWYIYYQ